MQNSIFIEFMEKYPDIAKGFTKRDKPTVDDLWQQLVTSLNSAGPPQKDVNGWRKTWTEWESDIRRKLAQNQTESRATGGGPFTKHQLSQTEETIVCICGMTKSVEGVAGNELGPKESDDDELPSTSTKRPMSPVTSTPKRQRTESTGERLKKFLDEDNERKLEINEKLDELIKIEKENASSIRRVYRAIEKGNESAANSVTALNDELVRNNAGILHALQEKNEIKNQQLELELQKFDYEKQKKK
ncbi:uncharacterized protein [Eurosta solidaginis]|uniref:uncharacterized protein n=1 Tax=Eurosta solidaginis TaxID=178769 RepID=UPI0035312CF8